MCYIFISISVFSCVQFLSCTQEKAMKASPPRACADHNLAALCQRADKPPPCRSLINQWGCCVTVRPCVYGIHGNGAAYRRLYLEGVCMKESRGMGCGRGRSSSSLFVIEGLIKCPLVCCIPSQTLRRRNQSSDLPFQSAFFPSVLRWLFDSGGRCVLFCVVTNASLLEGW